MIAVSDTGPILYLSLINCTELLPQIFEKVLIPRAVADELSDTATPPKASALIEHKPDWLHICDVPSTDPSLHHLGVGEQQSITLAGSVGADVLLTDDRAAKNFATQVANIAASGTIGVLYEAAMDDLVRFTPADFDESVQRLLATNFRRTRTLLEAIENLSRKLHGAEDLSPRGPVKPPAL
jgi:predicted nucleic acid-binding protein